MIATMEMTTMTTTAAEEAEAEAARKM